MPTIEEKEHKIKTLRKELSFAMCTANERYKHLKYLDTELSKVQAKLTEQASSNLRLNTSLLSLLHISGIINLILISSVAIYLSK